MAMAMGIIGVQIIIAWMIWIIFVTCLEASKSSSPRDVTPFLEERQRYLILGRNPRDVTPFLEERQRYLILGRNPRDVTPFLEERQRYLILGRKPISVWLRKPDAEAKVYRSIHQKHLVYAPCT